MLTGIVIVTYNSNVERLKLILNALVDDGIKYFVSDNSTSMDKKKQFISFVLTVMLSLSI
jgi:rhamnosyltransferase